MRFVLAATIVLLCSAAEAQRGNGGPRTDPATGMTTADALGNSRDVRPLNVIQPGDTSSPLTAAEESALFDDVENPGPHNDLNCMACHPAAGTDGRVSQFDGQQSTVRRRVRFEDLGQIQNLPQQEPFEGNIRERRISKPLWGRGQFDRVTEASMNFINAERKRAGIPVQGKIFKSRNVFTNKLVVATMGWRGDFDLETFAAGGTQNEVGQRFVGAHPRFAVDFEIGANGDTTSELLPDPTIVIDRANGIRKFLIPSPTSRNEAGQTFYINSGCAVCHQANAYGIPGIHSDLMGHDVGTTQFGEDAFVLTPSLAGVGEREQLGVLGHDGRADDLDDAVRELHLTGFALTTRNRWFAGSNAQRNAAEAFMRGL